MYQIIIKNPIYFTRIHIIITDDFNEANKKYNLQVDQKFMSGYESMVGEKPSNIEDAYRVFILVKPDVKLKILVHECLHIVNFILNHVSIEPSHINDEAQAYLLGWVFDKVHTVIEKYK